MTTAPNDPKLDEAIDSLTKTADALETWCAQGEINIIDRPAMARELRTVIAEISRMKEQQPERVTTDDLRVKIRLMYNMGCTFSEGFTNIVNMLASYKNGLIITDEGE